METCHIVALGPSGSGKSTLVGSVIDAMGKILETTGTIGMSCPDQEAVAREMGALRSQEGVLSRDIPLPTTSVVTRRVTVRGKSGGLFRKLLGDRAVLDLSFHDCPGALCADLPRFTREVVPLADVEVVLVPIDAALLMQAKTGSQEAAAHAIHRIAEIEDLLVEWDKGRARSVGHGLVVFCPVKCEEYFGDNGMNGTIEDGERLASLVRNTYFSSILDILIFFGQNLTCLYCPVDTIGSCRLTGHSFDLDAPSFSATFAMEGKARPFGSEMIALFVLDYVTRMLRQTTPNKTFNKTFMEMEKTVDGLVDRFRNEAGYARALKFC